ncbi:alanine racemase [Erysipelothrix sp. HDW6C]|uniref:alanine racemase n=1 Tax=Erysipelothrix sp. HDW6C TaxID=2714930 RepID=UPI001408268A|nr:alanine racemase [Erysipelothrix sp. HDW6C]QIK69987.1 alanine racemase [Erysipelothrix sp. HDW6C]
MIESVNIIVDESAVFHNTALLRKTLNPSTQIISVIKANGYGLGIVEIGHTCMKMGIDVLAVLDVEQAQELREGGVTSPILLMGATLEANFQYLIEYDLIQVIIDNEYAHKMSAYGVKHGTKIKTHVKVNTGLNRLGIDVYEEIRECYRLPGIDVLGIYSHFTEAQSYTSDGLDFSQMQIHKFKTVLDKLKNEGINPGLTHMQNSPSILNFGDLGFDAVRCGMVMFGLFHPSQLQYSKEQGYLPTMQLQSRVAMVRNIKAGEYVSYGRAYYADHDIRLATISAGYCDGIMKALSLNGGGVYINDTWCPILGDIAMSQFMVDVSHIDCKAEDVVTIFGNTHQSIYDYIGITGQSINEMISHLRYTIPRIYINTK